MRRSLLHWATLGPLGIGAASIVWLMLWPAAAPPMWVTLIVVAAGSGTLVWWVRRRLLVPLESILATVRRLQDVSLSAGADAEPPKDLASLADLLERTGRCLTARLSELQQRDDEHAQSEQLLRAVLRTMIEGVVAVDSRQRILFANDAARRLLEIDAPDVLGRQLWEVVRSPYLQDLIRSVLETGQQQGTEFELPRGRLVVSATAAALPRRPIPGAVLMLQDVTDLRRLEKLRQDFVSNVSHELKTPLTAIQAYADTLLDGALGDPDRSSVFLERIVEQAERLHALILDLLRLARIESQPEAYDLRPVSLTAAITECVESRGPIARVRDVALRSEGTDRPIFVRADAEELRTVLANLVDNAINYTPAGGKIVVRCSVAAQAARIDVVDTGIGISRDQQGRIFERFYRADRARERSRGGTGLGLAIVKHLVQLFGGTVSVASELGRGSTFTVTLPIADSEHTPSREAAVTA